MKPVDFTLHRPSTLTEALHLLAEYGDDAKVLAGGQSLIPLLNFRLARPEHLIDLSEVRQLATLRRTRDEVISGAMVTYRHAELSLAVTDAVPLLAAALPHVAHRPVRARGTIGGSIAHADPAAELPAVVTALDATIVASSVRGTRTIPARQFFVSNLVTVLAADEILTEIRFPAAGPGAGAAFEEVSRRRGDFALVGAGAQVTVNEDGTLARTQIALTGVAATPVRATAAEDLLTNAAPTPERLEQAAEAVRAAIDPSGDLHAPAEYRRHVAGTLVARTVAAAVRNATSRALEDVG